jgi:hypothetical protein
MKATATTAMKATATTAVKATTTTAVKATTAVATATRSRRPGGPQDCGAGKQHQSAVGDDFPKHRLTPLRYIGLV